MKLSNDMTYERKLLFIYYFSEVVVSQYMLWAVGCPTCRSNRTS